MTSTHRSEEHTSELQSRLHLVCRLLLEKKPKITFAFATALRITTVAASPTSGRPRAWPPVRSRRPAVAPVSQVSWICFFFNDTATTEIYTLSLHDALPISCSITGTCRNLPAVICSMTAATVSDRKSTRLNSSHGYISYAGFCLKKKKK